MQITSVNIEKIDSERFFIQLEYVILLGLVMLILRQLMKSQQLILPTYFR